MAHPSPCPTCKRIRAAHKRGITGRNDIAAKIGVSPATVTNHAPHAGVTFDRAATRAAVAAHAVDLRTRRQGIVDRLYSRSEAVLGRLEADVYRYVVAIPGQGYEHVDDDAPPAQDERALSNAISAYLASAAKLEQIDGAPGITKTASIITRVAEAFGISDA